MGWLFGHYDRRSLVNHLISGNGVRTLKNCFVGNNMWAVQEYQREGMLFPVRFICLYMLQGSPKIKNDPYNWGYKDVSEDMGPYQLSCPLSYIELVEAHEKEHGYETTDYALAWRQSVRERVAKSRRKFESGTKVKLYGRDYTVEGKYPNGQYRVCDDNGCAYRLKRSQHKDLEVAS